MVFTVAGSATNSSDFHRPFYLRQALHGGYSSLPPLEGEQTADIVIVGGGYAGLWTALEIKKRDPSRDIAIIEADICGSGASGRNGGLCVPLWSKFPILIKLCGLEGALRLCRASTEVTDMLERFGPENGIDFEFCRRGWLWAASCEAQRGAWQPLLRELDRHGDNPFEVVDASKAAQLTGSRLFVEGAHDGNIATIQPGLLARGLRRVALARGIRIYEHSPMTKLERANQPRVRTRQGSLRATKVILAMNAWSTMLPEFRSSILTIGTDFAVTPPIGNLLDRAGIAQSPYILDSQVFMRGWSVTADGRMAVGFAGGRLPFRGLWREHCDGPSRREDVARAHLYDAFPQLAGIPIAESWNGPIDRSSDGLPFFGALDDCPAILYGWGFSGNGVAITPIGGKILASLALDVIDEWSSCALVRRPVSWLPPEPVRTVGASLVRWAVARQDRLAYAERSPDPITRRLAGLGSSGFLPTIKA